MTSAHNPLNDFILTPQQQDLLFAALNSANPQGTNKGATMSPSSNPLDASTLEDSSYLDYDYSFNNADSSFDMSFNQADANGDGPSAPSANGASESASPETESPDKRSHPDDDDVEDNGGKRHEGSEKVPKKPGRKPLMSEPSSKRKAQNRAAQRAFRERKEKHLKDLEDKVDELQKTADMTKTENSELKAKIDKMTVELNEYKKKLNNSTLTKAGAGPARSTTFGNPLMSNINDVSFQFEFPKFGQLPGPSASSNTGLNTMPARTSSSSQSPLGGGFNFTNQMRNDKPSPASSSYTAGLDSQTKEDIANFSGIFSPPLTNNNLTNASRASLDSHFGSLAAASTSSPSASSNSHVGPSSSCGTSPEPSTQSPLGFKPLDTLTTIGEEQPSLFSTNQDFGHFSSVDFNDVSWLAAQNNFQFDPQIFGDYRDSQQNIIAATGGFDDSFFNDAFDADFTTPYNMPLVTPPSQAKTNILNQIDAAKEADDDAGALLTCNGIWERLQGCPKVRDGDFDLDGLCADLQKKAKCSGSGAVIDEKDFKTVMGKYLNPDGSSPCPDLLNKKA